MGWDHILMPHGLDHKLFIIALASIYLLSDWKKVLILVTAFTIGHSITLALVTFDKFPADKEFIEFLIPVTIFITAAANIFRKESRIQLSKIQTNYIFALLFGLIHGMAFATEFKALVGKSSDVIKPLLAFNIGIEVGQIIVVLVFLVIATVIVDIIGVARRDWRLVISSAVAGVALYLIHTSDYWEKLTA